MSESSRIPAQPQDAFNDFARIVADQQLGIVLEFEDHLDAERLAQAVADVVAAQPVLGCRFATAGRNAWHEPLVSSPGSCVATVDDAAAWQRAVHEAGQPLSASEAHLAVTHVRGGDADALAIRVDHTAADGQGAKAVAELLAAAYGGTLSADPRSLTTDRSWRRLRRSAGFSRLMSAAARRKADPIPTWGVPRAGDGNGSRRHDLVTLPAEDFAMLKVWGKDRDYTVNDIVLAAFYRAMFELLDPIEGRPMVVRVSFDQRRYLDSSDPMPAACNLSSVEPVSLPRLLGEAFPGTVSRVAAEMNRLKASSPGLGSAGLLELMYRFNGYTRTRDAMAAGMERGQAAGRTYPFLSNFGVLGEDRLRFGDLTPSRAVMLPVAAHPPFAMLGASSFGGELSLSLGFAEGEIDADLPPALLEAIAEELMV